MYRGTNATQKIIKKILLWIFCLGLMGVFLALCVNCYVIWSVRDNLFSPQQAAALTEVDCIVVLGCQVKADGTPSHMLEDRLHRGVELYHLAAAPKLLMSGDHGTLGYDEVTTMKQYAIDAGVPSEDVFKDHAGFSTYETVYRAKEIFDADKIIIVTQEYHLYRALYIAERLGVEAYGVHCDYRSYYGQTMRDIREILARVKDFGMTIFRPEPTYLGEVIPVSGNGNIT